MRGCLSAMLTVRSYEPPSATSPTFRSSSTARRRCDTPLPQRSSSMAIPWQTLSVILSPVDFAPLRVRPCAAQGFPCPHYVIIPISRGTTGDASKPTNALVFASTEPMQGISPTRATACIPGVGTVVPSTFEHVPFTRQDHRAYPVRLSHCVGGTGDPTPTEICDIIWL